MCILYRHSLVETVLETSASDPHSVKHMSYQRAQLVNVSPSSVASKYL